MITKEKGDNTLAVEKQIHFRFKGKVTCKRESLLHKSWKNIHKS